jgi:tetratricopeptide (TPR) repeat protein
VFSEHCFDQTPDLVFHAKGLQPGTSYTIRIVFYERGKAIAISVRNFRVAGIFSAVSGGTGGVVTIQTALQIAVQHQTIGLHAQAERIYREVLSQSPDHPYALHLLGVMFYQRGEAGVGAKYIEQALVSYTASIAFEGDAITHAHVEDGRPVTEKVPNAVKNRRVKPKSGKTNGGKRLGYNSTSPSNAAMAQLMRDVDNFHNSLGECYRVLGRLDEAKEQYLIALAINPKLYTAHFNLGLLYQQLSMWDMAVER